MGARSLCTMNCTPTSPNWPLLRPRDTPSIHLCHPYIRKLQILLRLVKKKAREIHCQFICITPTIESSVSFIGSQYGRFISISECKFCRKSRIWMGKPIFDWGKLWLADPEAMQNIREGVQVRNCMRLIMRCAGLGGTSLPQSTVLPRRAQIMPV